MSTLCSKTCKSNVVKKAIFGKTFYPISLLRLNFFENNLKFVSAIFDNF